MAIMPYQPPLQAPEMMDDRPYQPTQQAPQIMTKLLKRWPLGCINQLIGLLHNKENYLEHPIPAAPVEPPGQAIAAHAAWVKGQKEVDVLMLLTMDIEIQRNLAHLGAYDMLQKLKAMYSKQVEQELLQTMREFHTCKQAEGRVQKNQKNKPHKAAKGGHGKGKGKMGNALFASKPKTPPPPKKDNPAKDAICHQCGEVGYWRRNCPVYLAQLMKKKKLSQGASTLGSTRK
nr:zinc finger, CCHC-type [Tanacetum cinerariifolium]